MRAKYLNINTNAAILLIFITITASGCSKYVDVDPPITSVSNASAFNSDGTAIAVINGIYASMNIGGGVIFTGRVGMSIELGLSADELNLYSGISPSDFRNYYYTNSLSAKVPGSPGAECWSSLYNFIFNVNTAITALSGPTPGLTPAIRNQLLGESEFLRAFYYFYLVTLYGDVPDIAGTNYKVNSAVSRTPKAQVWQQIISDLQSSKTLLSPGYLDGTLLSGTTERVRPTQGAATALLARAYLYTMNWDSAEIQSTAVINNSGLYSLDTLNGVFLANSSEAIWQLQPVNQGWNSEDAKSFIIPSTGFDGYYWAVYLSKFLLNSFEPGDQRFNKWVDSINLSGTTYYYPYKYKSDTYGAPVTEYQMVFRLGEQYLIRAEAEAQLNDLSHAITDLNMIRTRAGLPNTLATTQAGLLSAISHERQVELFTEWGNRWLDLKRTNQIDSVMTIVTPVKAHGAPWISTQQLYPLPLTDIQGDPNLTQNPGY